MSLVLPSLVGLSGRGSGTPSTPAVSARYLQYDFADTQGDPLLVLGELAIYLDATTTFDSTPFGVATCVASTTFTGAASNMVDGNNTTIWAASTFPARLTIDLGSIFRINSIGILNQYTQSEGPARSPKNFTISTATVAGSFTLAANIVNTGTDGFGGGGTLAYKRFSLLP